MGATFFIFNLVVVGLSLVGHVVGMRRVIAKGTTEGMSLSSIVLSLFSSCAWASYGIVIQDVTQIVANGIGIVGLAVVIVVGHRCGRLRTGITVSSTAGFALALAVSALLLGPLVVSVVASAITIINKLPQIWESWTAPGGVAVSISSNLFFALSSAAWMVYGIAYGLPAVWITSAYCGLFHMFVVVRTIQGRRDVVPAVSLVTEERTDLRRLERELELQAA